MTPTSRRTCPSGLADGKVIVSGKDVGERVCREARMRRSKPFQPRARTVRRLRMTTARMPTHPPPCRRTAERTSASADASRLMVARGACASAQRALQGGSGCSGRKVPLHAFHAVFGQRLPKLGVVLQAMHGVGKILW